MPYDYEGSRPIATYYENARLDVLELVREPIGTVLDIGCGAGRAGEALMLRGAEKVIGIELDAQAAAEASRRYDRVLTGAVESLLTDVPEPCNTVLCLDILEHLVRPETVLAQLRGIAAPGAQLCVSVPNARHLSLVRDLVLRGTFGYREWGHRDRTHLRWFTRRDLLDDLDRAGWEPVEISCSLVGRSRQLSKVTAHRLREFLALQWYVLAIKHDGAG